ncbi:MAG: tRNA (adenosine(37)-N6)-dimethylallyltransferase MiaA [Acidimicrobiia bacterium]|nr:tRNA (adenosine(37)-N6)-dimethylallyltransferase MiaA [Acidimicrobiia bacterium]
MSSAEGGAAPPLAIVGTTASGKSALAMAVARARPGVELVSVDSMQVYRGMDIGTAKATPAERAEVPHHGLDLVDPWDEFTVAEFQAAILAAIDDVEARGARHLLVGGTGLYLRAVIDGLEMAGRFPDVVAELEAEPDTTALHRRLAELDPLAATRMEPGNRRRVLRALEVTIGSGRPFSSYGPGLENYGPTRFRLVGIRRPRPVIDERIVQRYQAQLADGFVDEVCTLFAHPNGVSRSAGQALGYKEIAEHLEGRMTLDEALELAIARTRRFARRQDRWFRRDPRIEWLDVGDGGAADPSEHADEVLRIWDRA